MSANEIFALEQNFKVWQEGRAEGLSDDIKPWVYYCVDQFLKPYGLPDEELIYGITDGRHDGGIDAIYFFVDKNFIKNDTKLNTRKEQPNALIIIIQVQSNGGFSPLEMEKQKSFTEHLLDLHKDANVFKSRYNAQLIEIMRVFKEKYKSISANFPKLKVEYFYITKIDTVGPDKVAEETAEDIKNLVKNHFSKAEVEYHFVNAQALMDQVALRAIKSKLLTWGEIPMQTDEGYVGLVSLEHFYHLITDESGNLSENMFEENVRGYGGESVINKQIKYTLEGDNETNFWLLNNGITIVVPDCQTEGRLGLNLTDPQIVNGLQTSREIYRYLANKENKADSRKVLVKVIKTDDSELQDMIVRATNSQSILPKGSLRGVDPIHHRIEDLFKVAGLYYDRRKGFYKDKGKPIAKIVSLTELIQAVVSILLQRPDDARRRPSDYLSKDTLYLSVYGPDKYPLGIYLKSVEILRRVQNYIQKISELDKTEKLNLKFYVAMLAVCEITQEAVPSIESVEQIVPDDISDSLLSDSVEIVRGIYITLTNKDGETPKGPDVLRSLKLYIEGKFSSDNEETNNEEL